MRGDRSYLKKKCTRRLHFTTTNWSVTNVSTEDGDECSTVTYYWQYILMSINNKHLINKCLFVVNCCYLVGGENWKNSTLLAVGFEPLAVGELELNP